MSKGLDELTLEIHKVISAPYAVCLKSLHNLLRQYDTTTVEDWVACHEDEVPRLAAAIVQSLALWPYALDILRLVAPVPCIRDAILQESPGLLNHLLERAIGSSDDVPLITSICISFLSSPLPTGFPLPASAQTLLSQLFETAMSRPSVQSIEPVYLLLDGACSDLLELLPQSGLDTLRDQLTSMMRTAKKVQEQPLSLYCLAIIAKLNTFHHVTGEHAGRRSSVRFQTPASQRTRDMSAHSWDEVQKFFQGDRALKTIHLLALQVIYACRGDNSDDLAPKIVRIAREVLSAIDPVIRGKWVQSNSAIVKKLVEKTANGGLNNVLQLEAVAFAAMLQITASQMASASAILLESLKDFASWRLQNRYVADALSVALLATIPQMREVFWKSVITGVCHTAAESGNICGKKAASALISQLATTVRLNATTRHALIETINTPQLSRLLQEVLRSNPESTTRPRSLKQDCDISLTTEVCGLILLASQDTPSSTTLSSSEPISTLALTKLKTLATTFSASSPPRPWHSAPISLMQQSCTPEEAAASHNWQSRLALELNFDSKARQESITRLIGQIVRDLQSRCDNVEVPLRAAQAKYEDLRAEHSKLQARDREAQNLLVTQTADIEALQRSKAQSEEDLEAALAECDAIAAEKTTLQETMQAQHDEDARGCKVLRTEMEERNLELRTSLACNEERLDDQAREIERLQAELAERAATQADAAQAAAAENDILTTSLATARANVQSAETTIAQQTSELQALNERNTALSTSLTDLEAQLLTLRASASAQADELTAAHTTNTSLTSDLSALRSAHDDATTAAATTLATVQSDLTAQVAAANAQLTDLSARATAELAAKDGTIEALKGKVQRYADECARKAQQLEEAQRMRSRLMLAMGLNDGVETGERAVPMPMGSVNGNVGGRQTSNARKRRSGGGDAIARVQRHADGAENMAAPTQDQGFDASTSTAYADADDGLVFPATALSTNPAGHHLQHHQHQHQQLQQDVRFDSPSHFPPTATANENENGYSDESDTAFDSPLVHFPNPNLNLNPNARAAVGAFKIPTFQPGAAPGSAVGGLKSARRRRTAGIPLGNIGTEWSNRDLRGVSPSRRVVSEKGRQSLAGRWTAEGENES